MARWQDSGGAARADAVGTGKVGTGQLETAKVRTDKVRTAKAGFSDLVLVCRKCAKRQGVDRKQIGRAIKRAFKQVPREKGTGKGFKVRVLETGCLGPCPKRMLTLATPDSLARRRVLLVDPALDAFGPEALVPAPILAPVLVPLDPETPAVGAGHG
ncbi:(2Fe-2S) ferredoxin domain-containing protein [Methylorubrum thiocyanatum]